MLNVNSVTCPNSGSFEMKPVWRHMREDCEVHCCQRETWNMEVYSGRVGQALRALCSDLWASKLCLHFLRQLRHTAIFHLDSWLWATDTNCECWSLICLTLSIECTHVRAGLLFTRWQRRPRIPSLRWVPFLLSTPSRTFPRKREKSVSKFWCTCDPWPFQTIVW